MHAYVITKQDIITKDTFYYIIQYIHTLDFRSRVYKVLIIFVNRKFFFLSVGVYLTYKKVG